MASIPRAVAADRLLAAGIPVPVDAAMVQVRTLGGISALEHSLHISGEAWRAVIAFDDEGRTSCTIQKERLCVLLQRILDALREMKIHRTKEWRLTVGVYHEHLLLDEGEVEPPVKERLQPYPAAHGMSSGELTPLVVQTRAYADGALGYTLLHARQAHRRDPLVELESILSDWISCSLET